MRDVYIAIMVAAAKGNGLRLTADEVYELSRDEAIVGAAFNALSVEEAPEPGGMPDWAKINPSKIRVAGNTRC
jgi:hypothetical protein